MALISLDNEHNNGLILVDPNRGCQPGASQCPTNLSRPLTLADLVDYQLKVDTNINGADKTLVSVINRLLESAFGATNVTYAELVELINGEDLIPGAYYIITDYRDNQMWNAVEPIMVLALTDNTLLQTGYSIPFPNQTIYYDYLNQYAGLGTGTVFKRKYDDQYGDTIIIDFPDIMPS